MSGAAPTDSILGFASGTANVSSVWLHYRVGGNPGGVHQHRADGALTTNKIPVVAIGSDEHLHAPAYLRFGGTSATIGAGEGHSDFVPCTHLF